MTKVKPNPRQLELFNSQPAPVIAISSRRASGGPPRDRRVSYGVALREITRTVKELEPKLEPRARGELVRTVMELAIKAGRVRFDFPEAA